MFLVSRAEEFVRSLCITVACGSTKWVSRVSSVRDHRVSSAKGKLVFRALEFLVCLAYRLLVCRA